MDLRKFSGAATDLSAEWRTVVETNLDWRQVGAGGSQGGEAGGYFVRCGEIGGYAKPGRSAQPVAQFPRAAHEKIAADLASDLGLPVPPAVLWTRKDPEPGQERFLSVSAIPFTPPHAWRDVEKSPELVQRLLPSLRPAASAMAAFDTWVGNTDRHNNGNLLAHEDVSQPTAVLRVAYIDYSISLSQNWFQNESWKDGHTIRHYPGNVGVDIGVMSTAISEIQALKKEAIENVIERVPEAFLPNERKKLVREALLHRQGNLRALLKVAYPELT